MSRNETHSTQALNLLPRFVIGTVAAILVPAFVTSETPTRRIPIRRSRPRRRTGAPECGCG